jgi:nitrogen fixation protein NifX
MGLKVAVASWDGEHVSQHFGRAEQFMIYEVDGENYDYVETRNNAPGCNGRDHDGDLLEQSAELLADCALVLVSRIGQGARNMLAERGIQALETPMAVEEAMERVMGSAYFKRMIAKQKEQAQEKAQEKESAL